MPRVIILNINIGQALFFQQLNNKQPKQPRLAEFSHNTAKTFF